MNDQIDFIIVWPTKISYNKSVVIFLTKQRETISINSCNNNDIIIAISACIENMEWTENASIILFWLWPVHKGLIEDRYTFILLLNWKYNKLKQENKIHFLFYYNLQVKWNKNKK